MIETLTGLRRRLIYLSIIAVFVILLSTSGYRLIGWLYGQHWTVFECLYMTMVTITTTGFTEVLEGMDTVPAGRAFTMVVMSFGAAIMIYFVSTVTAFIVEGHLSELLRRRRMLKQISKLRNHYIICGADEVAQHVIDELLKRERNFVVIEQNTELLKEAILLGDFFYIEGDPTEDENLISAGIEHARGMVIATPSEEDNLFITFAARELNPKVRIVCRVVNPATAPRLIRAGADKVVSPTFIGGLRIVSELIRPTVVSFIDQMLRDIETPYRIEEATVQEGSRLEGLALGDALLKERTGSLILAIKEADSNSFIYNPSMDIKLRAGMTLVVLANVPQLERLKELTGEAERLIRPR